MRFSQPRLPAGLQAEFVTTARRLLLEGKVRVALGNEYLNFRESASQVREAGRLPEVPLVVVTRGTHVWPKTHRGELMEKLWMDLQAELAESVHQTAHIVAEKSGHHIHLDQPELVADSIQLVIGTTQRQNRNYVPVNFSAQQIPKFKDAIWLINRIDTQEIYVDKNLNEETTTLISYKSPLARFPIAIETIDQENRRVQ